MNLKQVKQAIFLVDVNLPKKFSFFNSSDFIHVADIDPSLRDIDIAEHFSYRKICDNCI
jgi:hypothetical protein